MKLFIIIPFFSILIYSGLCLSQENITELSTNLVEINQKNINGELDSILGEQKAGEVDFIGTDILELQVANEELKKKLTEEITPLCNTQIEKKPKSSSRKEVTKGGWEVVLLVKATNETLGDNQIKKNVDLRDDNLRYNYSKLLLAHNREELETMFQDQIKDMSPDEVMEYISFIGGYLPYDHKRANAVDGHKEGVRNIFDLISSQKSYYDGNEEEGAFGGICGDIHFAMGELVRMAQKTGKSDCEYITMSYQTTDTGHVIGGCANQDGSFLVLNYGEMRLIENPNGVASLSPVHLDSKMPDVGTRMRIFSNIDEKAEHIATLKNEVGSFLYAMNLKAEKHSAGPLYEDYSALSTSLNHNSQKIIKKDKRTVTKEINQGLRFYTGKLQGGQDIFGVAVYRETNKTNDKNSLNLFHSNSLSINSVKYPAISSLEKNPVNLYFLHHLGARIPIIQKGNFKLIGELSEQIDFNGVKTGSFASVDADLTLNAKLDSQWKSNDQKTQAHLGLSMDKVVGFKEERLVSDYSVIPKNIKFTTNALNFRAHVGRKLASDKTLGAGTNIVTTQVGSKYEIYTDFSSGIHHIYVQYENAGAGFGDYKMNLLPNAGKAFEAGYSVNVPYRQTDINASTKISYDMNKNVYVSAGVKLKINGRKKVKEQLQEIVPPEMPSDKLKESR